MATGWWAATLVTISTKLGKLTTTLVGDQTDFGTIATSLQQLLTSATAPGNWSLGMATTLNRMSTSMPGVISETGTIATTMKKLLTSSAGSATVATYDSVGAGTITASSGTFNFNDTATAGADIFGIVKFTVSTNVVNSLSYNGVSMTQIGSIYYDNNDSSKGGVVLFHLAGAGTGSSVTVALNCTVGSGRVMANVISANSVTTVGTPVVAYGNSGTVSQSVTVSGGFVLESLSCSGGPNEAPGSPSGATQVYTVSGGVSPNGGGLTLATVTSSGTVSSTLSTATSWCAVSIPIT